MPVIVLSDQFIAQRRETLSMLTLNHDVKTRQVPTAGELENYKRYRETKSGISPMTWPGMKGGEYQTNGLEHAESGRPTSMFLTHEKNNAKRYRKLRTVRDNYSYYRRYGAEKAEVGVLCWGSSKGPVKEAVLRAQARGEKVAAFVKNGEDEQARDLVGASDSPMGRVLAQALEVKNQSQETMEAIIVHATEEEVRGLSRYLQALATIGNIAPLLGLFGTVVGMIKAFMVIQEMGGKVNAAVLAGGIWEAMLTTALGLAVALPTIIAHSYLVSKVNQSEARLQRGAITFLKAVMSMKGKT
jgi:biopolymer transport protein ExbB